MNKARGFTLIEILVALTLFAVVGGSLLQLFHSGLRTARLADNHTHAVLLARSKLTELQSYGHLQAGVIEGQFNDGYRWRAELRPNPEYAERERGRLLPLDLVLTISWGERDDQREFILRSLLLTREVET